MDQEIAQRLAIPSGPATPDSSEGQPSTARTQEEPVSAELSEHLPSSSAGAEGSTALSRAQVIGILDEVTGINVRIGAIVVAEIGTVVDRFPSEAHICSWAGLCPAAKISAGKRLEPHNGQGESVVAPSTHRGGKRRCTRASEPCLRAYYQRLRKRMGHKKAIVALAHRILVIIYHLLKDQQPYRELGPDQDQEKAAEAAKRWALRRLEQLGYQVTLEPTEVA